VHLECSFQFRDVINLARFGYRIDMKVEKNRILLYSWLPPTGTYHKNLVMWNLNFFFFQNLENLSHFFHGKSFVLVEIIIFKIEIWRDITKKEKHCSRLKIWCLMLWCNVDWFWANFKFQISTTLLVHSLKSLFEIILIFPLGKGAKK